MMIRLALAVLAITSPAFAGATCDEYNRMIYDEGVRTLVTLGCIEDGEQATLPPQWNFVLETPAGACAISRSITAEPAAVAFMSYVGEMNRQRKALGCPPAPRP